MGPKQEAAFNIAFNKIDAKAKAKFNTAMEKAKKLRDQADAIELVARFQQNEAFKNAMSAGNRAAFNAGRDK